MKFFWNQKEYPVIIEKKNNRNTYIRVKDDFTVQVTTSYFTKEKDIQKLLEENEKSIIRMIQRIEAKHKSNDGFFYLGKHYDIVITDRDFYLGESKVFLPREFDLDKWYKKQAKKIYQEHLTMIFQRFSRKILYPSLCIRKMSTRWGVCNTKEKKITLNLELMKREEKYLDYVIVHELSHLIHPNHSAAFWSLVEENCPDYKKIRKEMKEF